MYSLAALSHVRSFVMLVAMVLAALPAPATAQPDTTLRAIATQTGSVCEQAITEAGTGSGTYGDYEVVYAPVQGGSGSQVVVGTAGDDSLAGGSGDDVLCGFGGDDVLEGGSGHDHLDGGDGTDTHDGGSGNDTLVNGEMGDAGSGTNTVIPGTSGQIPIMCEIARSYDPNTNPIALSESDFTGCDLSGVNFTGADLSQSVMNGANLTNANLTDANLYGASLEDAILTGVVWSNTTCPIGINSDANGGTCQGA